MVDRIKIQFSNSATKNLVIYFSQAGDSSGLDRVVAEIPRKLKSSINYICFAGVILGFAS